MIFRTLYFHPLRVRGYWSIKLEIQFHSKSFQRKNINISYNNALKLCTTYTHIQFSTSVLLEAKSVLQLQLQIWFLTINFKFIICRFKFLWNNNNHYIRWVIENIIIMMEIKFFCNKYKRNMNYNKKYQKYSYINRFW